MIETHTLHTRRVKEAIYIRLHPDNINRDDGIEILEGWIERPVRQQTAEGTTRSQTSRKPELTGTMAIEIHQSH